MNSAPTTVRLTVGQAILKYLAAQYTELDGRRSRLVAGMLGIFGHGNVAGIGQALLEGAEDLPLLPARSEQAMVHVAAGYAKSKRRLSTYACTSSIGPGAANMVTGAALATVNRLPVLLLPADYFARRRPGTVLQQLEHTTEGDVSVNDAFRPVSRYFDRVMNPEQLIRVLPDATRVLTSPAETGAVVLSLPQDVQAEAYDFPRALFEPHVWSIQRRIPAQRQIDEIIALLEAAQRPVIIAGGGVLYSEAEAELREFAERAGIPVTETFAGKGSMSTPGWASVGGMGTSGNPAANELLRAADLVLCLGTRMTDSQTGSQTLFQNPDIRFIAVNVVERDAAKQGALAVVADVRETLRALLRALAGARGYETTASYREEVQHLTSRWAADVEAHMTRDGDGLDQAQVVKTLNDFARSGDIVVSAAGTLPTDLLRLWDTSRERDCYLEFGFSCMTHEIPGSIGARLARDDGEVYVLVGDGSFLMNPTEIATAVQLGLKITVVIVENYQFQSILGLQLRTAGEGDLGNEFVRLDPRNRKRLAGDRRVDLDLVKVAEGLGATAVRVDARDDLVDALTRARADDGTTVIVVGVNPDASALPASGAWRDVPVAQVARDPAASDRWETYRTHTRLRRVYL